MYVVTKYYTGYNLKLKCQKRIYASCVKLLCNRPRIILFLKNIQRNFILCIMVIEWEEGRFEERVHIFSNFKFVNNMELTTLNTIENNCIISHALNTTALQPNVLFLAQQPRVGQRLIQKVSRSHTTKHHIQWDSSGRVISSSQRPLSDNTQHSHQTNIHAPRWDSNTPSQQASDRRPTP
jgi:hypothetical protein